MAKAQSDLVVSYKLETEFFQDHVRHPRYVKNAKNRNEKVREDWSNCGELGRGGFGVVNKQIRKATGQYRAVKTINKRPPAKLDYSRELLVMAILAKHPPLFVVFLGWFEDPENLYIAMEYIKEGDLSKHMGTPLQQETVQDISKQILEGLQVMHQQGIAHRDLKPANIFVVSMSPVWVKLGDFGVSKRIRAQATTTFHTQVSTQVYSAPEVLGLDSNSESSNYTNSVDIWSLGCLIYELLVGTKLFVSEFQLFGYFYGKWPFPEDKLNALSAPTGNNGISLLKSMLLIQPEDRPTAAGALSHEWLAGPKNDGEDIGDGRDQAIQNRDESSQSRNSGDELPTHGSPKRSHSERNPISKHHTRCLPRGVPVGANPGPLWGRDPTTPKAIIDTSLMTVSDIPSVEIPAIWPPLRALESALNFLRPRHSSRSVAAGEPQIDNISQTFLPANSQAMLERQTLAAEMIFHRPRDEIAQWNTWQRKHKMPLPPHLIKLQQELSTGEPTLPDRACSGRTVRAIQTTQPGIRRLTPGVPETAEDKIAQPSIQCETLTPGEVLIRERAGMPEKFLLLAGILTGILMLAGILTRIPILAGISTRILRSFGAPTLEEIETSDGNPISDRT